MASILFIGLLCSYIFISSLIKIKMFKILILLVLFNNANSMAKYENPYGENTEGWYFLFGTGPSLTNNHVICDIYPDECITQDKFRKIGVDIFFYKHITKNSLIGIGSSGKWDIYEFETDINQISEIRHDHYLYSLSIINFLKTFGGGAFLRFDIGAAMNSSDYHNHNEGLILESVENRGRGILFGAGYSLDFKEMRLLLGLNYTTTVIEGENDNYLNLVLEGLF